VSDLARGHTSALSDQARGYPHPERGADRATFDDPKQFARGVEDVLVNGLLVIDRRARAADFSRAG
jgi:hypothetical protein